MTLVVTDRGWRCSSSPTRHAQFQFVEQHSWIPQFGVSYAVGVDGIALSLIAHVGRPRPGLLLAAWHDVAPTSGTASRPTSRCMLVLETFMIGVFAATDVFLFYVFFEAMLDPGLLPDRAVRRRRSRQYAAVKFLLYSLSGGLLMLAARHRALRRPGPGGPEGFLLTNLTGLHLRRRPPSGWLFLGFFIAFAIKAPMCPVHTWLPDAAAEATPGDGGAARRRARQGRHLRDDPLLPAALPRRLASGRRPVVIVLALISIVYGALLAIGQTDIMRLIAYTSVSHFGFIVLGIFAFTTPAQAGVDALHGQPRLLDRRAVPGRRLSDPRRGSRLIPDFGGWQQVAPVLAGVVPGRRPVQPRRCPACRTLRLEFLVLVGTFPRYQVAAVVATIGIVLAALYILLMYQRTMTGPKPRASTACRDRRRRETWVVAPLLALIIVLGLLPEAGARRDQPGGRRGRSSRSSVTDPAPTVRHRAKETAK